MEKLGVKETKEIVVGLVGLSAVMAKVFKDGAQASDVAEVIAKIQADEELKAKLVAAYNGIEAVPAELKDIDLAEGVELTVAVLPEIKKLIEAVRA